ncbi:putative lipoprotein [Photobacterium aphoticum]|uniref:Putative lipoprotein n=1 Tax=Photobacterium aphoticum TaxID=754436 RepID=A0A090R5M8_9GAMM|nr:putative lipoprotein [Photobacterium aphoticum]
MKFDDIKVGIGRVANDRVNLDAKSQAKVTIMGQKPQSVDLNVSFSAVPYYDKEEGAIFLNDLNVENIDIQPNELNVPTKQILSPVIEWWDSSCLRACLPFG